MNNKVSINKRLKGLSRDALENLSKSELIDKIVQLEAYNFQLKNLLQKKLSEADKTNDEYSAIWHGDKEPGTSVAGEPAEEKKQCKKEKSRKFNWTR